MSGSSLDGLDMALCRFEMAGKRLLSWKILEATTHLFDPEWVQRLLTVSTDTAKNYALCHAQFGRYIGKQCADFLSNQSVNLDLIASHGHTIFHFPEEGLSSQIGDGAAIAAITGHAVVDNFRMQDVALGGQGAPLAPLADAWLLPEYSILLNLGGIANISCRVGDQYIAFDNTGANQVLNALAQTLGLPYDEDGKLAARGRLLPDLKDQIAQLPYFQKSYPKSLGNDWVQREMTSVYLAYPASVEDKLHTACLQIAERIVQDLIHIADRESIQLANKSMLVTGGGAFNAFLIQCLQQKLDETLKISLIIPDKNTISYKEAALIALMGLLRIKGIPNCLPSATGATKAAVAGAWHHGWIKTNE
ncbi:MAG TPA: anhydro-N-acetylmuramic acid kinase [Saprospiraceae bacterium]|nr:anhydro-N-acetylmuramic acid kinase [Saprospiraceae bacterium]HMQ84030.1 anhydro-N-acetylmuramic acid kinase [Saprospiraceae bacterium]